MASFDIVNKIDLQKIDNAVNTAIKELVNRYDLKDEDCEIELDKKNKLPNSLTIHPSAKILQLLISNST